MRNPVLYAHQVFVYLHWFDAMDQSACSLLSVYMISFCCSEFMDLGIYFKIKFDIKLN